MRHKKIRETYYSSVRGKETLHGNSAGQAQDILSLDAFTQLCSLPKLVKKCQIGLRSSSI